MVWCGGATTTSHSAAESLVFFGHKPTGTCCCGSTCCRSRWLYIKPKAAGSLAAIETIDTDLRLHGWVCKWCEVGLRMHAMLCVCVCDRVRVCARVHILVSELQGA